MSSKIPPEDWEDFERITKYLRDNYDLSHIRLVKEKKPVTTTDKQEIEE